MFKSPNDMVFESKQGQGAFIFKGRSIRGERVEATSLSAPELDSITTQLEVIRGQIRALSSSSAQPIPTTLTTTTTTTTNDGVVLAQLQEVREQILSADLPGLLSQMDEIRASVRSSQTAAIVPVAAPQVSVQQLSKLQDQVTRLVGQLNTLQDRVSIIEGHMRVSTAAPPTVIEAISDVASAAASAAASTVVNRAALKLEDMVSPGALYNLRKVSERGPIKYAW